MSLLYPLSLSGIVFVYVRVVCLGSIAQWHSVCVIVFVHECAKMIRYASEVTGYASEAIGYA